MNELVHIKLRLHIPGARVGDIVQVSKERAAQLVHARYATVVDGSPGETGELDLGKTPAVVAVTSSVYPVTELPAKTDVKAVWVEAAETIGIPVVSENGKPKTKQEIMVAVLAAVDGDENYSPPR